MLSTTLRGNGAKKLRQEDSHTEIYGDFPDSGSSRFASKQTRKIEAVLRPVLAGGVRLAVLLTLSALVLFILIWRRMFDIGQFTPLGDEHPGPHSTFTVR